MGTPSVTIVRTGTSYPTIQAAVAASQKGDTLNIQGTTDGTVVTYNEAEMNVDWDLNFVVVGAPNSAVARPYNSATGTWRAVTKGLFVIGQTGTYPRVVFNGLHITQCSASINNSGEVKGTAWGLNIPEGAPLQTGDGNGAGIRFQAGDLTFENGLIDYCQDGILGQPFIWGTGNITLSNSTFRWCGTGLGQQHNLYIGRVKTVTITNVTSDHSLAGQNVKSRAITTTVTGCTLGSADADDFSNNQLQNIEGTLVASGNTITKPPKSTNPFPIEIGGVVPMYPDSTITITDNTFNDQYGVVALVWNWFPVPVTVSGLAVTSVKAVAPPVFNGFGASTGVTFNGVSVPDGSGSICQALTNLQSDHSITNLSGTAGPQTVTLATDTAFIGGTGVLSATSILNMSGVQVIGGPGGVDINVGPPGGGVSFANHPGDAPSTVYISNPQNIFSNSVAAPGAGDQITVDSNGGSYVLVSGQGAVINHSNNEPGSAGHFEMKQSYDGIIPEGTLVSRGGVGAPIFIDNAGTLKLTGTVGTANFNAYSPAGSPAPAVMIFDNVWSGVNYGGVFTGGAFNIDQSGTHAGALVNSYSDAFCVNVYQPTTGNWEFTSLLNDILDFGPSVGATAVTTPANYLEGVAFAVVTGSGASSLSVNSPGLIQVIGGYNDGGTLTVTNYNATQAPVVPIALLDVTASAPVQSGSTWTLTLSNGTVLTLPNGVTPNLTLPAGASDMTLTAPAVAGTVGVAQALGATVTDAYAAATVGFVKAAVTGVTGATVAFGADGVFVGTFAGLVAALAAGTVTPTATTGGFTLTVWNQAGYSQSATVAVSASPTVVNWPAAGGAQGPYTSSGTTYNTTGTPMVTTTITGSDNVFNAGVSGSITLTDNTGGNTLKLPGNGAGKFTLTNGAQWTSEVFDLTELLTSAGFVHGGDPTAYLQVAQEGANAHLQVKNAGGAWVDKLVLTGATVTLAQILTQSITP